MRFHKFNDLHDWHLWFAWHPVRAKAREEAKTEYHKYETVWLENVERRCSGCDSFDGGANWEYRLPKPAVVEREVIRYMEKIERGESLTVSTAQTPAKPQP